MKRHVFCSIPLLASLLIFSGCQTYPASTTTASTQVPVPVTANPAKDTLQITLKEMIQLFAYTGIPVHILEASKKTLSFQDERLTSPNTKESGKLMFFSSSKEAFSQYKALVSNNKTNQYIYQNRNSLLILSNQFSKTQANQYKETFFISGDFSDSYATETPSSPSMTPFTATNEPSASVSPTHTPSKAFFENGTYVIGSIMPAGEYVITSLGSRCKVTLTEGMKKKHTIFDNTFSHNIILTVHTKEILTIDGGTAIPIADYDRPRDSTEGMFKVGQTLSAGTYTITLTDTNMIGFGNVQIMKDSMFQEDSILSAQLITSPIQISLKEGEYIKLSGAHLDLQ